MFFTFVLAIGVNSQTRQTLEEQRRQVLREIEETNRLIRETVRDQEQSVSKLGLLNAQVTQYNRLISSINSEIAFTNRQINTTSANIRQLTSDIEKMKTEYSQLLVQAYKNKGNYNRLIYILSSKDFNEAYRRMKYFQQYSEYRKRQVAEIQLKQIELNEAIEQLKIERADNEQLLAERRQESAKLQSVKAELDRETSRLRTQVNRLRTQLQAQQQRERQIQLQIERIIAEEASRRGTTTANMHERLTPEERLISTNFRENRGKLPWPMERGTVTGKFGIVQHPLLPNVKFENTGISITTVADAEVRAVFDGVVVRVGGVPGANTFVLLQHGNFFTAYQNLVEVAVKQGDRLTVKQPIGKAYTERGASNAEFQFQIYEGAKKLNPELWLSKM